MGRAAILRPVENLLEPQPKGVQRPQPGELVKQRLQLRLLLPGQVLRVPAEFPHQRAKHLPLRLGQAGLVRSGDFFRWASMASLNNLATWKRSTTACALGNSSRQALWNAWAM